MDEHEKKRFELCCHIAGGLALVWNDENKEWNKDHREKRAKAVVDFADAILAQLARSV